MAQFLQTHAIRKCLMSCLALCVLLPETLAIGDAYDPSAGIDKPFLKRVEKQHGQRAKKRLLEWKQFIKDNQQIPLDEKLTRVNAFFNQKTRIRYGADAYVWQKKDYWATPTEFLIQGAGDCEDYSIAKYFTLLALGVPIEKLQLTYVKVHVRRQGVNSDLSHMVLSYFVKPGAVPLILDNMIPQIRSADKRENLEPIFSFNGERLWLSKLRDKGQYKQSSPDSIKAWAALNARLLKQMR